MRTLTFTAILVCLTAQPALADDCAPSSDLLSALVGTLPQTAPGIPTPPTVGCPIPRDLQGNWQRHPAGGMAQPIIPAVVAVLDDGVDISHPALARSVWTNEQEIAGDGIDNDRNGYVDDVHGIATEGNLSQVTPASPQADYHGTHVAGIIVGEGLSARNAYPTGSAQGLAKILPIRMSSRYGIDEFERSVDYLVALKDRGENIRVVNASWGGPTWSVTEQARFRAAIEKLGKADILFVAATDNRVHFDNVNGVPDFPANNGLGNSITVASLDSPGTLSNFSSFGNLAVHIATLGRDIVSTVPGGGYERLSGTSMATPRVAAFAARRAAEMPWLDVTQLRDGLLARWRTNPSLAGTVRNGTFLGVVPPPPPGATSRCGISTVQLYIHDGQLKTSRLGSSIDSTEAWKIVRAYNAAPSGERADVARFVRGLLPSLALTHQANAVLQQAFPRPRRTVHVPTTPSTPPPRRQPPRQPTQPTPRTPRVPTTGSGSANGRAVRIPAASGRTTVPTPNRGTPRTGRRN